MANYYYEEADYDAIEELMKDEPEYSYEGESDLSDEDYYDLMGFGDF